MKRKILMIANYFYPDFASTGQLMTELCEEIQNDFDITVIAAVPNYVGSIPEKYRGKLIFKEKYKNINILRVRVPEFDKTKKISRLKYILCYFLNSIIAILKSGKQDVVFSISQPPILGGVLGVLAKRIKRAKFIYNIQDFNPEQIEAVKYSKNKIIIELARKIDMHSCKVSDKVLVVGNDMSESLSKRFKNMNVPSNVVVNNWIDENKIYPLSMKDDSVKKFKKKYDLDNKFIIMYSGNIGLYYDLENLIKVAKDLKQYNDLVFVFVGDGVKRKDIEQYKLDNNLSNIKFIPYQEKEYLNISLNVADAHLVVNAAGIKGVSVPSKIYGVLATGKFVIGVLEKGSEARNIVELSNCGQCVEPLDYEGFRELVYYCYKNRNDIGSIGMKGRIFLEKKLTKQKSIDKYRKLLHEV